MLAAGFSFICSAALAQDIMTSSPVLPTPFVAAESVVIEVSETPEAMFFQPLPLPDVSGDAAVLAGKACSVFSTQLVGARMRGRDHAYWERLTKACAFVDRELRKKENLKDSALRSAMTKFEEISSGVEKLVEQRASVPIDVDIFGHRYMSDASVYLIFHDFSTEIVLRYIERQQS